MSEQELKQQEDRTRQEMLKYLENGEKCSLWGIAVQKNVEC